MSAPSEDRNAVLRRSIYLVLIAVSLGGMLGRVLAVNAVDRTALSQYLKKQGRADWQQERPFLSGNDRSRWATVRALVEQGTYRIDDIVTQPNWDTIDMVKHDDQGKASPAIGHGHLYSSKPPLLATLMAGPYWVIVKLSGATLATHPYTIGRVMLVIVNIVPFAVYFFVLASVVERFGTTDWGRIFVMACATFATFLSTFVIVINNHLPAAVSAAVALLAALRIVYDSERHWGWFCLAGLATAFTAANELPALAFFAMLTAGLAWVAPWKTLLAYAPAALLVAAASLGTNYLAHHTLIPPYAQRSEGDNWYAYQYVKDGKVRDSYWMHPQRRSLVDQGEPSTGLYAFHTLIGHHGIFSLTPVWLLSVAGVGMMCFAPRSQLRGIGWLILVVSGVCVAFYIARPLDDRNYGGMTSGFRWVFWFAPLWLFGMLPAADSIASRRWLRGLACVLLALSVMSVSYPTWNPWIQPWLLEYLLYLDWVQLGPR
jgi:hypothetical protein